MIALIALLEGSVEVPFPIVATFVGLITLGTLVYFTRRVD